MAACRSCCSAVVLLLALALGSWEAFLQWELRAATRARPPADLQEVPTFDEAALPHERFVREFVQRREPVKVRLADVDVWNASRLLEQCGDSKTNLLSHATYTVLKHVPWPAWFTKVVEVVFAVLTRRWTTLNQELMRRVNVKLSDYAAEVSKPVSGGPAEFSMGLPLFVRRLLPPELIGFMEIFARPRYLHDLEVRVVCPEAMNWYRMPRLLLPNWAHLSVMRLVSMPALFWGQVHSQSYPMHRDFETYFDFAMIILRGKKRYALFDHEESPKLARVPGIANAEVFAANPFAPDVVATPGIRDAAGWRGVINAGEMLYVPAGTIHQFDNYDFEEATVGVKWWYLSHEYVGACEGLTEAACAEKLGVSTPGLSERGPTAQAVEDENRVLVDRLVARTAAEAEAARAARAHGTDA